MRKDAGAGGGGTGGRGGGNAAALENKPTSGSTIGAARPFWRNATPSGTVAPANVHLISAAGLSGSAADGSLALSPLLHLRQVLLQTSRPRQQPRQRRALAPQPLPHRAARGLQRPRPAHPPVADFPDAPALPPTARSPSAAPPPPGTPPGRSVAPAAPPAPLPSPAAAPAPRCMGPPATAAGSPPRRRFSGCSGPATDGSLSLRRPASARYSSRPVGRASSPVRAAPQPQTCSCSCTTPHGASSDSGRPTTLPPICKHSEHCHVGDG